jgi:hypothetical protein
MPHSSATARTNIKAVMPGRIDHSLVPGTAVVLNLYPHTEVWADYGPDCEGAAGKAGAAVLGGVGGEFGGAQDHILCPRAVFEECAQVGADGADVLGAAGVGGLGAA